MIFRAVGRWTIALLAASLVAAAAIQVVGEIGARDTRDRVREAQLTALENEARGTAAELARAIDDIRGILQATGAARIGLDTPDLLQALETKDHDRLFKYLVDLQRAMPLKVVCVGALGGTPGASAANPGFEPIARTCSSQAFGAGIQTQVRGAPRESQFGQGTSVRPDSVLGPQRTRPWVQFFPGLQVLSLAIPVLGSDGRSRGTISADVYTPELFRFTTQGAPDEVMYIVDRNGILVERLTPARLTTRKSGDDLSASDAVRKMLAGAIRGEVTLPLDDAPLLAASASTPQLIGPKPEFDLDLGFHVLLARPASAVYADVDATLGLLALMRWALSGVLVVAGLALGVALDTVGRRRREAAEALERQTATAEILKVISASPTDTQPVFDAIAESARRFCRAQDATVVLRSGDELIGIANVGVVPDPETWVSLGGGSRLPLDAGTVVGRAVVERRTVRIGDIQASDEYPLGRKIAIESGHHATMAAPLIHHGEAVGAILLRSLEKRPFTDKEAELVETFASQAVIAIENVRLFNEIQEKSREIEAASRHKSEFLANMSHELRTPLNAVIGFSDVLEQRLFGDLNERQSEYVRDISSSGRHLLDLVNEILDLSKVEAGRMELEPTTFAIGDTVLGAFNFVRERAAKHTIELAADVPSDLGTITADERKVRQILLNLLSNAVKFTPDGGWVGVSARREDGEIRVSVRDTGIGIAPEDQPKVFEEFRQVGRPSDRSREGTGLGLTLAKRFIELHGGRIWLESEMGKGTTFTFALPRVASSISVPAATPGAT